MGFWHKYGQNKLWILLCMGLLLLAGCGKTDVEPLQQAPADSIVEFAVQDAPSGAATDMESSPGAAPAAEIPPGEEPGAEISPGFGDDRIAEEAEDPGEEEAPAETSLPDEHGTYTSKEDVALYLHTYGHLPENFMTKKQAQKLGWQGRSLEDYAPGMCIGGDYFGNYEGLLPKDKKYRECDIDTLGRKKRGAKRIIYSDDGDIYYTDDHYETFERLY